MPDSIIFADGFDSAYDVFDVAGAGWTVAAVDCSSLNYALWIGSNYSANDVVTGRTATGKAVTICRNLGDSNQSQGAALVHAFEPTSAGCVHFAAHPNYYGGSTGGASSTLTPLLIVGSASARLFSVAISAQTGALSVYLGGSQTDYSNNSWSGATLLTNSLNGLTTATSSVSLSTWNVLRVVFSIATSGGLIEVYSGSSKIFAFSGNTKPGTATAADTLGLWGGGLGSNNAVGTTNLGTNVYRAYDDVIVTNTAVDIGECTIISVEPSGAGTTADWTANGSFALGNVSVFQPAYATISVSSDNPAALYDGRRSMAASTWLTTYGNSNGTNAVWAKADFGASGRTIGGWRFVQRQSNYGVAYPIAIQGSADNTNWTTLDSTNVYLSVQFDSGIRRIASPASYRYYRVVVLGTVSGMNGGTYFWQLAELEMFDALSSPTGTQSLAELPNDTTSFVSGAASGDKLTLNWTDLPANVGTVKAVQLRVVAGSDTGSATIKGVARVSGTDYDTTATATVSGSGSQAVLKFEQNPASSSSWTRGAVNASEFGVKVA